MCARRRPVSSSTARDGDWRNQPRRRGPQQVYDILRAYCETNSHPSAEEQGALLRQIKTIPSCEHFKKKHVSDFFSRHRRNSKVCSSVNGTIAEWLLECPDPTAHTLCTWATLLKTTPTVVFDHVLTISTRNQVATVRTDETVCADMRGQDGFEQEELGWPWHALPSEDCCVPDSPTHTFAAGGSFPFRLQF
ncbi:hypothetical protein OBBRIDRAFT_790210 [Obba rivulosa]|uniref:Uncharacterized protein n=1 Tax=Obba rivulosa TaxID=1052685 RepID=A0A8E2DPQ3_9APHY|nr:hypothetical protein OBBRIDRAFT_790210 [Obba rivulosa]